MARGDGEARSPARRPRPLHRAPAAGLAPTDSFALPYGRFPTSPSAVAEDYACPHPLGLYGGSHCLSDLDCGKGQGHAGGLVSPLLLSPPVTPAFFAAAADGAPLRGKTTSAIVAAARRQYHQQGPCGGVLLPSPLPASWLGSAGLVFQAGLPPGGVLSLLADQGVECGGGGGGRQWLRMVEPSSLRPHPGVSNLPGNELPLPLIRHFPS